MTARALATSALLVGLGWMTQLWALRAVIEHELSGSLLAGGATRPMIAAAAGAMLLRIACVASLAAVPAVAVWRLTAPRHAKAG